MPALPAPSRPSAAAEDPSISAALTVGPCAPIDALYNELDLSWEVRLHARAWCTCAGWRLLGSEGACLLQPASASRRGLSPVSRSLQAWWQELANELDNAFLHITTITVLLTSCLTLVPVLYLQYEELEKPAENFDLDALLQTPPGLPRPSCDDEDEDPEQVSHHACALAHSIALGHPA